MNHPNQATKAHGARPRLSPSWRVGAPLLLLAFARSWSACSSTPITDADGVVDGSVPDGTLPDGAIPDTGVDAEPPPKDCLSPTEPAKNPEKCLVDAFGAFVSPSGDDANEGTKAKPYKTLGRALQGVRTRVVMCEGEYAGSVDVTRPVEIYGGVTCDFSRAGAKAKIVASKPAYSVKVEKVSGAVVLADLDVVGINAAAPSESSVGLFVTESGTVKVLRSRVEAGDGADAPPARDGNFTFPADALLKGANADDKGTGGPGDDTGGAAGATGTCPGGGSSKGGKGGDAALQGDDASPRPPGGAKGAIATCVGGGTGGDGDPGSPGTARAGAATPATLAASGLAGTKGQDGSHGTIGGGGGGGGGYGTAGAGGGGGAGGCGGQGGFGGGAGGSSIAILSFSSTVTVEGTDLVAKNAKAGGAGGKGQAGQGGATGGNRSGAACNGGNGAKGGDGGGGGGGGGAGGIAAGIAWAGGKEPTKDAATKITRPTSGPPAGGEGGAGASNKGVDGVHGDVVELK